MVEAVDDGARVLSVCEVLVERIFGSLQFRFSLFTELGRSSVKTPLGRCHELCGNEDGFLHVLTVRGGPPAGIHVARIIVVRVRVSAVHLLGRRCESKWQREFENSSNDHLLPMRWDSFIFRPSEARRLSLCAHTPARSRPGSPHTRMDLAAPLPSRPLEPLLRLVNRLQARRTLAKLAKL